MNIQQKIVDFVKQKNSKKNIQNIRSLIKIGENEWSFFYTFIDGNCLSISKLYRVTLNKKTGKLSYIKQENRTKKKTCKLVIA